MKLSTRSRYGVRMMHELALHYEGEPVILKDIAARQDISEKYLSKLVIPLKGASLVNSARGAHGGYTLSRHPSKITLLEIVEILEGGITPVECVKNEKLCGRSGSCTTRDVWCRLDRSISGFLASVTLEDLVQGRDSGTSAYCI